jgi:hypothetical protein
MAESSVIAILSPSRARAAHLAEIVRIAGMRVEEGLPPSLVLLDGRDIPESLRHLPVVQLVKQKEDALPQAQIASVPMRAAALVEMLQKTLRKSATAPSRICIADHDLDLTDYSWSGEGREPVRLTEKEAAVLSYLHGRGEAGASREDLLENVWSYADGVETHTLETHIYRLRQKIEKDPARPTVLLTTENGYRLAN